MRHLPITVFLICLLLAARHSAAADVRLIVHPDVPGETLAFNEVQNIFLGQKAFWSDGVKIMPAVLDDGGTHRAFLDRFIKKTASQFSMYWKRMIFTGKGMAPPDFETEAAVVEYVSGTVGGIGYVGPDVDLSAVKVLEVR